MSLLDALLLAAIVLATIGGYRLGFVARVISWIGLGVGLFIAVKFLPWVLRQLGLVNPGIAILVTLGFFLIGATLGQALGFMIGGRIAPRRKLGSIGGLDRFFGAAVGFTGAIVLVWLVVPIFVASPGWLASQTANSWIARTIDSSFPRPPDAMQALRSALGNDAFPEVFDALRPTPALGPPPIESGLSATTYEEVARSVVKVEGAACSNLQDGTGFVIAVDLIATNAHVVAGERSTSILRNDGRSFVGQVVAFDPDRDLALVQVRNFDRVPLPLARPDPAGGVIGGVFGHPGGESLRIAPFSVARTITATGLDIYGTQRTERRVLEIAASLRPGDSGSGLIDPSGNVVGIAFAIARDRADVAYALAPSELEEMLRAPLGSSVSTGPCL